MQDEPQAPFHVFDVSHANGFSDQAGHAVAPFVIESFDHTGFAAALVAGSMLPGREAFGTGFVKVGGSQLAAMSRGDAKPHLSPRLRASVADLPGQHLARQARNCEPQVFVASLKAIAEHQFVQFQSFSVASGQKCIGETQARLLGLFLSSSRMVVRATLKVRAIARAKPPQSTLLFPPTKRGFQPAASNSFTTLTTQTLRTAAVEARADHALAQATMRA